MCVSRAAFSRSILAFAATLSTGLATPALAQGFAPGFHTFQAPEGFSWAQVVLSDDGATVSGNIAESATSTLYGFTLSPTSYTRFAEPGAVYSVSDGGAYTSLYNGRRASDGTIEVLDPSVTIPAFERVGSSISRDGRTIAASNQIQPPGSSPTSNRAYRWTEGFGVTVLPQYRPGAAFTEARDISGDGQVIVGSGRMSTFSSIEAWVWTESGGITILQDAPGSSLIAYQAEATNNDGSIVAGFGVDSGAGLRGLIWENGNVTVLPAPSGYRTVTIHDLSDDGEIILGQLDNSNSGLPTTDAVWTDATGWVPIFDFLRSRGLEIPLTYRSLYVDVSADGTVFSGSAIDGDGFDDFVFVAVVPAPSTLAMFVVLCGLRRRTRVR